MAWRPEPGEKPGGTYEPDDNSPDDADDGSSSGGAELAYIEFLTENEDWETLELFAKRNLRRAKQQPKVWRKLLKGARKRRRADRPALLRGFLLLLKIIGGLLALVIAIGILDSLSHH